MKTYVLIISNKFPQTHKRKGEPTYFPGKILDEIKIHTIRANYDLWAKRIAKINNGEAVLSLRHWYDKPYRSPQIEFAEFTSVGIEKLEFEQNNILRPYTEHDGLHDRLNAFSVAEHDGLSFDDFQEWFNGYSLSEPMAIIHFTDFRYNKT